MKRYIVVKGICDWKVIDAQAAFSSRFTAGLDGETFYRRRDANRRARALNEQEAS